MFIDKAEITIKSGDGGNGIVSFLRLKGVPYGGPDGGNGGNGGNIVFVADKNSNTLTEYYYKKKFVAQSGESGGAKNCNGRSGEDLILRVPQGTIIRDYQTGSIIADLFNDGDKAVVLEGGRGGKGNASFCTSTRKSPSFSQQGEKTEAKKIILELKLIADVGIIGFPNAGKSTFLSVVSRAKPKIANYPFTTLAPNLGVVSHKGESFIAADIPGLIEGAAQGQGLGHKFLRHTERTRMLIHIIDMSGSEGRNPIDDYKIINKELAGYSKLLSKLPQIVAANKMDIGGAEQNLKEFVKHYGNITVFPCSAISNKGVGEILDACIDMLSKLPPLKPVDYTPYRYEKAAADLFEIVKLEEDVYEVRGGLVETLIKNITLDDVDSFNYFQRQLKQRGVLQKLKEAGIKNKDTVVVGDVEFEYIQ